MPGDAAFTIERDDFACTEHVPFDDDDAEHAHRAGRCLAEMLDRAFPDGVADHVIAALLAARLSTQVQVSEEYDPHCDMTVGEQVDCSSLSQALIPTLGDIGVSVRFDDL